MADTNKNTIYARLDTAGVRRRKNKCVYPMNVAKEKSEGDALLLELSKGYVSVDDVGKTTDENNKTKRAGINSDETINFAEWFSAYMAARSANMPADGSMPGCFSLNGFKAATKFHKDLFPSPNLVHDMSVTIGQQITLDINFHKCLAWSDNPDSESDYAYVDIAGISVKFPRTKNESVEDVAEKFLRFALSLLGAGSFEFRNLVRVSVFMPESVNIEKFCNERLSKVIAQARERTYANPLIHVKCGRESGSNSTQSAPSVFRTLARDYSEEFKNAVIAFDTEGAEKDRTVSNLPYGYFKDGYFGDHIMKMALGLRFQYGKTMEETVLNAIEYTTKSAAREAGEAVVANGGVAATLFGGDAEEAAPTPAPSPTTEFAWATPVADAESSESVTDDATSNVDGASDESLEKDYEEDDNASLEYGLRVKEILDMYTLLYRDDMSSLRYVGVGLIPSNCTKEAFVLYERSYRTEKHPTWEPSSPFMVFRYLNYLLGKTDYGYFRKAMGDFWRGLYAQSKQNIPLESFSPKRALPTKREDLTWLDECMKDNKPNVAWFPFIHAAMMRHYAPWDFCKEHPKHYSWDELRGIMESWLLAIFKRVGEITNDDATALDALKESMMRHFVLSNSMRSFSFSVYWSADVEVTEQSLTMYFTNSLPTIANTLVSCDPDTRTRGRYMCTFVPDLNGFLGETLLGYEILKKFLDENDGKLLPKAIPIGITLGGRVKTLNVTGAGNVFPAAIRAGARSGKGVLTQLLMIALLGCGRPFIYLDSKPDMAKTWAAFGRRFGVRTLGADPMAEASQFILAQSNAAPFDACAAAVLSTSDYAPLLNGIYFGKLVALMYGLSESRLSSGNRFSDDIFDTFIIADEVNVMGKSLKTLKGLIPDSPSIGSAYAAARKEVEKAYKAANKGGVLPKDMDVTVGEFTFKVCEWDKVLGSNGKGEPLKEKIQALIEGVGTFFGTLTTSAPKAHVYPIYIGQTDKIDLGLVERNFATSASLVLRAPQRMALIGKGWSSPTLAKEQGWGDTLKTLEDSTNSDLTEGDPVGVFLYKASRGDKSYQVIRTGVVLAENDAELVEFVDGAWTRQEQDMTGSMLKNIQEAAGDKGAKFSKAFRDNKLLITESTANDLAAVGMTGEIGKANPLVTFDGLLEYVARLTKSDPKQPIERLYTTLSALLKDAGSGFADVYTYLSDPSAMYTGVDLSVAVKSGKPLVRVGGEENSGSNMFAGVFDGETTPEQENATPATTGQESYTVPIPPMPTNPARQPAPLPDPTFGRAMPSFDEWAAQQPVDESSDVNDGWAGGTTESEPFYPTETYEDNGETVSDDGTVYPTEDYGEDRGETVSADAYAYPTEDADESADGGVTPPNAADYYGQAGGFADTGAASETTYADAGTTSAVFQSPSQHEATPHGVRTTQAPPVCGRDGAASRYAGGATPVAENSDGTVTIEVPGGRVQGYYTSTATVQALSHLFTDKEVAKMSATPKGRELMAMKSMLKLVEMMEEKTGLQRGMIKSIALADNCIFVRDACVVGGKPGANDLYDYIDLRNLLKALKCLTVLQMDRDAYFHLVVRPGYKAEDLFFFSQTLQTLIFDKCQILRDGRIVGESFDSVKDSFISQFDAVATDATLPMSPSKVVSGGFLASLKRRLEAEHTPEYMTKRASIKKAQRELYGKRAEKYLSEDRPVRGLIASIQHWWYDRQLAKLQKQL